MIADKQNENYHFTVEQFVPKNGGLIEYSWPDHKTIELSWGEILKETPRGTTVHPTFANLFLIKKPNLFMNSVCGLIHAEARGEAELIERMITGNKFTFHPKENAFTKSNKYATFAVIASVNRDGAAIPYQPVRLHIATSKWRNIPFYVYLLVILMAVGLVYAACHYKRKAKITQKKLDYEMNDIRNVARMGFPDDHIEKANLKKASQTAGMMDESDV